MCVCVCVCVCWKFIGTEAVFTKTEKASKWNVFFKIVHLEFKPPYPLSYWLNSTTTVLLQGGNWHLKSHEDLYAIKQRNQTPKKSNLRFKI